MLVAARALQAAVALAITCLAVAVVAQDARPPTRIAVWIDTDPAIGEPERDVDDGFALVQAFRSPELEVRGISVVFGNAPLSQGAPIARRLVRDFGPADLRVFSGAASENDRGVETEASRALAARLVEFTQLSFDSITVAPLCRSRVESISSWVRTNAVVPRGGFALAATMVTV